MTSGVFLKRGSVFGIPISEAGGFGTNSFRREPEGIGNYFN